jgi:hypothetical protein
MFEQNVEIRRLESRPRGPSMGGPLAAFHPPLSRAE